MREREKILIVGSGAREHAIGWKIAKGERELFFAPGNAGTEGIGKNLDIGPTEIERLVDFSKDNAVNFTVVGPEQPLADGIVNVFSKEGLQIFGQKKESAMLESDKAFAVRFMRRHNIPHPPSKIFVDPQAALGFLQESPWEKIVIKASGLAQGKGVFLPDTPEESVRAIRRIMIDKEFGDAGDKIVIQKRLKGKEISLIGFVSNEVGLLAPAQDYKRAFDGDLGPNTGGMGAYAPSSTASSEIIQSAFESIINPTVEGARLEGFPLNGAIYFGLMLTDEGLSVIEYNVRFGDPESQVQFRLLRSDLLESMKACVQERLEEKHYYSSREAAVGVVMAAEGYPGNYKKELMVEGLDNKVPEDIVVFHGATEKTKEGIESNGGRIITVTAVGKDLPSARSKAYEEIRQDGIKIEGSFYREDIAKIT